MATREPQDVTITTRGLSYRYLAERWDDLNEMCVTSFDQWEPRSRAIFASFAATAKIVVDVGAYTGVYSIETSLINPNARIIACEPNPATATSLNNNLALNGLTTRIEIHEIGLGLKNGIAIHNVNDSDFGTSMASFVRSEKLSGTRHVQVRRMDSAFPHLRVDLMKVDIEGGEVPFLWGARRTLRRNHPVILMEALRHREYLKQRLVLMFLGYGKPVKAGDDRGDERNYFWGRPADLAQIQKTLNQLPKQ